MTIILPTASTWKIEEMIFINVSAAYVWKYPLNQLQSPYICLLPYNRLAIETSTELCLSLIPSKMPPKQRYVKEMKMLQFIFTRKKEPTGLSSIQQQQDKYFRKSEK